MGIPIERAKASQLFENYRAVFRQIVRADRVNQPVHFEDADARKYRDQAQALMIDLEWMFEGLMRDFATKPEEFSAIERKQLKEMTGFFRGIYRNVARAELSQLNLGPDCRVLQVGMGPMPLSLVQFQRVTGAQIAGIDVEQEAVSQAKEFFSQLHLQDVGAEFHLANGVDFDYAVFDVILIAATARPKDEIVLRILETNKASNLHIVNRDTSGWSSLVYRPNPLPDMSDLVVDWQVSSTPVTSTGYIRASVEDAYDA